MSNTKGRVTVISGPMYAGKSRQLILIHEQYKDLKSIAFKPAFDHRTTDIVSRSGISVKSHNIEKAEEIFDYLTDEKMVFIDEFHFFGQGIAPVVRKLSDMGIRVVVSGLDKDFLKVNFESYDDLKKEASKEIKMTAICHSCGRIAKYSRKTDDTKSKAADENSSRLEVDNFEETKYFSSCEQCHPVK